MLSMVSTVFSAHARDVVGNVVCGLIRAPLGGLRAYLTLFGKYSSTNSGSRVGESSYCNLFHVEKLVLQSLALCKASAMDFPEELANEAIAALAILEELAPKEREVYTEILDIGSTYDEDGHIREDAFLAVEKLNRIFRKQRDAYHRLAVVATKSGRAVLRLTGEDANSSIPFFNPPIQGEA